MKLQLKRYAANDGRLSISRPELTKKEKWRHRVFQPLETATSFRIQAGAIGPRSLAMIKRDGTASCFLDLDIGFLETSLIELQSDCMDDWTWDEGSET